MENETDFSSFQYKGLWTHQRLDILRSKYFVYGCFRLWVREEGKGKILERYNQKLVEAHVHSFSSEGGRVSFIKTYDAPRPDLIREEIFYDGQINLDTRLIEGKWGRQAKKGFPSKKELEGDFYLAEIGRGDLDRELGRILLDVEQTNLIRDIAALQDELPYTPVHPR
jgi:hypothetical protein